MHARDTRGILHNGRIHDLEEKIYTHKHIYTHTHTHTHTHIGYIYIYIYIQYLTEVSTPRAVAGVCGAPVQVVPEGPV